MKALLVDDDPDAVLLTSYVLEAAGWQVACAGNGTEALQKAVEERPLVVLLDYQLPDMDGPEVLRRLRELPETASIPVVFLTGKTEPEQAMDLERRGACGVIHKPFDPATLAEDLERLLG